MFMWIWGGGGEFTRYCLFLHNRFNVKIGMQRCGSIVSMQLFRLKRGQHFVQYNVDMQIPHVLNTLISLTDHLGMISTEATRWVRCVEAARRAARPAKTPPPAGAVKNLCCCSITSAWWNVPRATRSTSGNADAALRPVTSATLLESAQVKENVFVN